MTPYFTEVTAKPCQSGRTREPARLYLRRMTLGLRLNTDLLQFVNSREAQIAPGLRLNADFLEFVNSPRGTNCSWTHC